MASSFISSGKTDMTNLAWPVLAVIFAESTVTNTPSGNSTSSARTRAKASFRCSNPASTRRDIGLES